MIVNDEPMKAEFEGQIGDAYFGLSSFEKPRKLIVLRSSVRHSQIF
jgi:hypothetical protein